MTTNTQKFGRAWVRAAAVRALRTVAQTAVAAIGTSAAIGDVAWGTVLSTAALAGVLSILTRLTGLPETSSRE